MIRLSIPARAQALAKLTLPVLIATAFGLMLLGKADAVLAEHRRMALADALAPIYAALAEPLAWVRDTVAGATDLWELRGENARLREENAQLLRWQSIALALDAENQRLKANLRWIPTPPRPISPPAWWPMPAASMPRRCCSRSGRTTASARARSRSTSVDWSAASPRSARAPPGCCCSPT